MPAMRTLTEIIKNDFDFLSSTSRIVKIKVRSRDDWKSATIHLAPYLHIMKNDWIMFENECNNLPVELFINGFCNICQHETQFRIGNPFLFGSEGLECALCGMNSRLRAIWQEIFLVYKRGMNVYINEYCTRFYVYLSKYIADIIGSEYEVYGNNVLKMHALYLLLIKA